MSSREIVEWLNEPANGIAFTDAFLKGTSIKERAYNIIVPGIPTTFDTTNPKHLREVEETNSLGKHTVTGVRWIKPIRRRRPDQTHAYAIFTIASVDAANTLIRDGMYICGTKTRPKKQKREPIQCMKCRRWGHFATECLADTDTCGTCREDHRTNTCNNRDKRHCISCEVNLHASWDRNCPEFLKRCEMFDEHNPQNAMPYYPTEHDWTLTIRPDRIPLDQRFPGKYVVNSLPTVANGNAQRGPRPGNKECRCGQVGKNNRENPNQTPLGRGREEGELPLEAMSSAEILADFSEENMYMDDHTPDRFKG
jgi:hypothetical protein